MANALCEWWARTVEAGGRDLPFAVDFMEVWRIVLGAHYPDAVFDVDDEEELARARPDSALAKALRTDGALRDGARRVLADFPADLPGWLTDALGGEDGRPSLHPAPAAEAWEWRGEVPVARVLRPLARFLRGVVRRHMEGLATERDGG